MSNVIEKLTKIIKDDSGISEIIDKKLTKEAQDKILYIEARLQAINEIASNSCSDVKDADNIISFCNEIRDAVANVPDTKVGKWIPISYHQATEEDYIDFDYHDLKDVQALDCKLPDNDTEILVCGKNGAVWIDTYFNDDGCYLDSGEDLVDDIVAWQPLPEPFKESD